MLAGTCTRAGAQVLSVRRSHAHGHAAAEDERTAESHPKTEAEVQHELEHDEGMALILQIVLMSECEAFPLPRPHSRRRHFSRTLPRELRAIDQALLFPDECVPSSPP